MKKRPKPTPAPTASAQVSLRAAGFESVVAAGNEPDRNGSEQQAHRNARSRPSPVAMPTRDGDRGGEHRERTDQSIRATGQAEVEENETAEAARATDRTPPDVRPESRYHRRSCDKAHSEMITPTRFEIRVTVMTGRSAGGVAADEVGGTEDRSCGECEQGRHGGTASRWIVDGEKEGGGSSSRVAVRVHSVGCEGDRRSRFESQRLLPRPRARPCR